MTMCEGLVPVKQCSEAKTSTMFTQSHLSRNGVDHGARTTIGPRTKQRRTIGSSVGREALVSTDVLLQAPGGPRKPLGQTGHFEPKTRTSRRSRTSGGSVRSEVNLDVKRAACPVEAGSHTAKQTQAERARRSVQFGRNTQSRPRATTMSLKEYCARVIRHMGPRPLVQVAVCT